LTVFSRLQRRDTTEEIHHAASLQPVKDLRTTFLVFNDAGELQEREVTRNRWHLMSDQFRKLKNAALTSGKLIDDEQACGMRESFEDPGLSFVIRKSGSSLFHCHTLS
jgi:hypothetical protein